MTQMQMRTKLEKSLSYARFEHSIGVAQEAVALAKRFELDVERAYLCGLLHDCAKEISLAQMQTLVLKAKVSVDQATLQNPVLLHGPAGAVYAREEYDLSDEQVFDAISCHVTGRAGMSDLAKILYLADLTEPTRKGYEGLDTLRSLCKVNLDDALLLAYDRQIEFNLSNGSVLHPATRIARDFLIQTMNNKEETYES